MSGDQQQAIDLAALISGVLNASPGEDQDRALDALRAFSGRDFDMEDVGHMLALERSAEAPLRDQRLAVLGYLARVRPGVPIVEGLASLSDAERVELDALRRDAGDE